MFGGHSLLKRRHGSDLSELVFLLIASGSQVVSPNCSGPPSFPWQQTSSPFMTLVYVVGYWSAVSSVSHGSTCRHSEYSANGFISLFPSFLSRSWKAISAARCWVSRVWKQYHPCSGGRVQSFNTDGGVLVTRRRRSGSFPRERRRLLFCAPEKVTILRARFLHRVFLRCSML